MFVLDLIKRRKEVINTPIEKVIYVYFDFQPIFHELQKSDPNIIFTNNIHELNDLITNPCLIILDDQQDLISNDKEVEKIVSNLFIKTAHHHQASTICVAQNAHARNFINITRNTNYLFLFDLLGDKSILISKSRQICPGQSRFLLDAYEKALSLRNYGYLMLCFHPGRTYKKFWARSHLDPVIECQVYVPK